MCKVEGCTKMYKVRGQLTRHMKECHPREHEEEEETNKNEEEKRHCKKEALKEGGEEKQLLLCGLRIIQFYKKRTWSAIRKEYVGPEEGKGSKKKENPN